MEEAWQKTLNDPQHLEYAAWIIEKDGTLYIEWWTERDEKGYPTSEKPCDAIGDFHTHPPEGASMPSTLDYFHHSRSRGYPLPNERYSSYIVTRKGIVVYGGWGYSRIGEW